MCNGAPLTLLGHFLKVLGSNAAQGALFGRCVTLMDVTTHNAFPFLHVVNCFRWLIKNTLLLTKLQHQLATFQIFYPFL